MLTNLHKKSFETLGRLIIEEPTSALQIDVKLDRPHNSIPQGWNASNWPKGGPEDEAPGNLLCSLWRRIV